MKSIGLRIKEARQAKNLKQDEFAELIGLTKQELVTAIAEMKQKKQPNKEKAQSKSVWQTAISSVHGKPVLKRYNGNEEIVVLPSVVKGKNIYG